MQVESPLKDARNDVHDIPISKGVTHAAKDSSGLVVLHKSMERLHSVTLSFHLGSDPMGCS